ncbi:MAG: Fic family protein [Nitrososphaera sp.]
MLLSRYKTGSEKPIRWQMWWAVIGKESFSKEDIDALIEFNRRLMARRGHNFDVNRGELDSIFKQLGKFRSITDHRTRIINMAAWILYGIAESRPFFDGNKTSASTTCIRFLNWNGYDLLIELLDIKREMHRLLTGVQRHYKDFDDVREFLKRSVITFRSR